VVINLVVLVQTGNLLELYMLAVVAEPIVIMVVQVFNQLVQVVAVEVGLVQHQIVVLVQMALQILAVVVAVGHLHQVQADQVLL
jgi:hypothetical protein